MIKLERKNNKILLKEFLLKLIFFLTNLKLFKKLFINKVPKIYSIQKLNPKKSSRLVFFSTFNKSGTVTKNLIFYIQKLYELNSDIILIDTSPVCKFEEIEKIKPFLKTYIWRENIGYDFGSWKVGVLNEIEYIEYEQILFTNDSIIGPIFPLEPIFKNMSNQPLDIWGLTDSYEIKYHIMSYFLVFQNEIIKNNDFIDFWKDLLFYPTKWKKLLIFDYEIGGTKYWLDRGYKLGALIPYIKINKYKIINLRNYLNPTHVYWDTLLTDFQFPFLKKDLIRALKSSDSINQLYDVLNKFNIDKINFED